MPKSAQTFGIFGPRCPACWSPTSIETTVSPRARHYLPTNKQGIQYADYSRSGRRTRKTKYTRRAIPVAVAEQLVADCYARININEAQYVGLAKKVEKAFDERFAARSGELAELAANRQRLEDESDNLLAAHFADTIDLTTLKRHQDRIRAGLADIDRRIENEHDQDQGPRRQINKALRLLIDCQRLYKTTDAHGKRLANQTFTTGIDINEDEEATLSLAEPFAVTTGQNTHVRGSTTSEIVELLRNYSNSQGSEKPVLALISEAARGKTPRENRNKKSLQPRVRRLSDSEAEELVQAYNGGDSVYALGHRFGIHRTTVSEHLKRAGVQTRGVKKRTLTSEEITDALRLREQQMSIARIATAIGTTEYAVRRELGRS